jgi:hypothetical protein
MPPTRLIGMTERVICESRISAKFRHNGPAAQNTKRC